MRGSNHTLTCSAEGGPGNEVSWVKLGTETEISDGPELVIAITDASVGGVYQCTVENLAGSDSATAVVNGELKTSHFKKHHFINDLFFPSHSCFYQ